MNDAQLSQFTLRLRHLQQSVPQYENGQDVSENQLISALRFVASLEQLRQQQPLLKYPTEIERAEPDAQMRAQQISDCTGMAGSTSSQQLSETALWW